MTELTVGREPVQIVEIVQPLCTRTYGVAPCTASGPDATRCFNTRSTCQDAPNFVRGGLSLYFSSGRLGERKIVGAPYIIPSLVSVSTSPTRINLAGSNPDATGLGNRALCTLVFQDHPHSDFRVDPYLSGRVGDPLKLGSFWSKWIVRNRYRQNIEVRVYEGYVGQALSAMVVRKYFLQSVQGPDDNGRVTIQCKDILTRLEERKAQAPIASNGELRSDILAAATTIAVTNALVSEYTATGTLRIGDEIMTYTGVSTVDDYIQFTGVVRGTDNTVAANHSLGTAVQQCLRFTGVPVNEVLETLLVDFGGIDVSYLDLAGWLTETEDYMPSYFLDNLLTQPRSVVELVSDIQIQTMSYLWWDERAGLVKLKAIRGIDVEPPLISSEKNIVAGSFSLEEMPRQRASQVWVYYERDNFIKAKTEPSAYNRQVVIADLESETEELYGEKSVRTVFADWLSNSALAQTAGSKVITRYVDTPSRCEFTLDAKDRSLWVGDTVTISHFLDVDVYGQRRLRNWTIIAADEIMPGEMVKYEAEDTTLYGKIAYVMADDAVDYPGPALAPFKSCYIGNADGLLSDGTACGRIN